ncbi:hypothetical protein BC828DRAFT_390623 [Blastocladiella britannica]|nr:hypothetical protein BC828DRAFT_390623 [Blastocladiella britannica]
MTILRLMSRLWCRAHHRLLTRCWIRPPQVAPWSQTWCTCRRRRRKMRWLVRHRWSLRMRMATRRWTTT